MKNLEDRVIQQLERKFSEYMEDILSALRQPSVSKTGEGIQEMADWVVAYLKDLGAEARTVPGKVAPIVEGELNSGNAGKTLLFYDLYDVQPADGKDWISPPFDAIIHKNEKGEERIVSRGTFNSKGPLVGFLTVLKAFQEAGVPIPVNFRFLIEGEEEIGSPSLEPYIRENKERLSQCDAAFIPFFGTKTDGETPIRLGFKGAMFMEFTVEGGEWGGPIKHDLHAMHTAWIDSPAWELLNALTSLRDRDGRVTIDGIESQIMSISQEDLTLIEKIAENFERKAWLSDLGAARFKTHTNIVDLLSHLMFDTTLNIDLLKVGEYHPGEDPTTLMPRKAIAHVDLRLVPKMEVQTTLHLLRDHLDKRGFKHVKIKLKGAYPFSKSSINEPVVQSMVSACRKHADNVVVYPLHAGAAPMYLFTDILGIPFAFGGLGYGMYAHLPNEFITVEGLRQFQRSMVSFLFEFANRS